MSVEKDWLVVFGKYGFAGLVAAVLLYVIVFDVRTAQTATRDEHSSLRKSVDAVVEIAGQSDMAQQQILYVLQTMCVNAARTEGQRDDCQRRIDTRTR